MADEPVIIAATSLAAAMTALPLNATMTVRRLPPPCAARSAAAEGRRGTVSGARPRPLRTSPASVPEPLARSAGPVVSIARRYGRASSALEPFCASAYASVTPAAGRCAVT
jgi:hypothetical protein